VNRKGGKERRRVWNEEILIKNEGGRRGEEKKRNPQIMHVMHSSRD
jgi:hypothetical protein